MARVIHRGASESTALQTRGARSGAASREGTPPPSPPAAHPDRSVGAVGTGNVSELQPPEQSSPPVTITSHVQELIFASARRRVASGAAIFRQLGRDEYTDE